SMDIGAVLDLMIHDLDLLLALVHGSVRSVQALGVALLGSHEDIANARLTFTSGCIAQLSASRVSRTPSRRMESLAPEGFVEIDFARRHLTLVQPTEELRARGIEAGAWLRRKDEVFSRYLQVEELDCLGGDQLTKELQHFVRCVQTGARPRVSVEDGRA